MIQSMIQWYNLWFNDSIYDSTIQLIYDSMIQSMIQWYDSIYDSMIQS
jgi:hypothetical protein